jgi:hypothetical protein
MHVLTHSGAQPIDVCDRLLFMRQSSSRYIYRVIIWQALLNAVIGFALATAKQRASEQRGAGAQ